MDSNIYLVTGATAGIGKALVHELARIGGTVIMVARDEERGARVKREISSAIDNARIDLQLGELGNLSSVRNLATIIAQRYEKIDALINNASVYKKNRAITVDGYETMFVTNHLAPFLLTYLLLDRIKASGSARILNITAPSTTTLNFEDLQGERNFNSLNAFGASKMANLLFTFELARRLEGSGVTVNAIHPGLVRSGLMREAILPVRLLTALFSAPASRAAAEIVRIATAPEYASLNGKFLHKGKEIAAADYALDPANQARLWELSEQLTRAPEIVEKGADFNPTGSVYMNEDHKNPEGMVRPEDNQVKP